MKKYNCGILIKIVLLSFSLSACSVESGGSLYTLYAIMVHSPVDRYNARYIEKNADITLSYDGRNYHELLKKVETEAVEQKTLDGYEARILIRDRLNKRYYRIGSILGCRYFIVTDRKSGICSFEFYTQLMQPVVYVGEYFHVDESGRPVK